MTRNSARAKARLDWLFIKRFCRIISLIFSNGPETVLWVYLLLLAFKTVQEVITYQSGVLISKFYLYLNTKDQRNFNLLVCQMMGWWV